MKISIDFRHSWSFDRVARIQREDLAGKMAVRVVNAINARLSEIAIPCNTDSVRLWIGYVAQDSAETFPAWNDYTPENLAKWDRLRNARTSYNKERIELETLKRYYEPRTYYTKELDDLTAEELQAIDDSDAEFLPDRLQRVRKALLKE